MTREEINKYVEMGDIENDEEITTERAIAEVYRWIRVVEGESYEYENLTPRVLDIVIQALSTKSKWIPVSERLPEEHMPVMVSTKLSVFPEARYSKKYGWEWAYSAGDWRRLNNIVIAWMPMPLPAPYKESEDDKNGND